VKCRDVARRHGQSARRHRLGHRKGEEERCNGGNRRKHEERGVKPCLLDDETRKGDFVEPHAGAPKDPLYIVARRDLMRIFMGIPETDAVWVKTGMHVGIRIPTLKDQEYAGTVKRMSYSLKRQSRTLLTEIDIPNPGNLLRPGMYARASLDVERSHVLTLPESAVATLGNVNEGYQDFCFVLEGGKVRRMPVGIGLRGEGRVQVLQKQVCGTWEELTREEQVVEGGLSALAEGQQVRVASQGMRSPAISRNRAGHAVRTTGWGMSRRH
jgi:hypothetical protein